MIDPGHGVRDAVGAIERAAGEAMPESVRRALACEGTGRYRLGAGGRDPSASSPLDANGECDCSGFLAFCWNEPRKDSADGEDEIAGDWIYTDSLYVDARGPQRFGREISAPHVEPGDALVYRGHVPGVPVGHCAIVIARPRIVARFADLTVIHCHGPTGGSPAITRSSGALWDRRAGIGIRRV